MRRGAGPRLYARARRMIPGGTQLLSKRPELHLPGWWPSYCRTARGATVTDLDGRRLTDFSYAGIGACILGYADPDVNAAVHRAVDAGSMSTLNCPEEVELAELLLTLHPWAQRVRFARTGGEAMAVAVRIVRAASGRDEIAFCGYHGWHDWYLSANLAGSKRLDGHLLPGLAPAGVPRGLRGTLHPFRYNHLEELQQIIRRRGRKLAAIVMEPLRHEPPHPGFLKRVRALADRVGAALVFDEITSGWRFRVGGAHLAYGVTPDVAVFAKGMSNGYPMAAIIGVARVLEAAQTTFISSSYWTERIGPAAALATIAKLRRERVPSRLEAAGRRVQAGWRDIAARRGLPITVSGLPALSHFTIVAPEALAARTLFTQLMLEQGFLATGDYYAMFPHRDRLIDRYLDAADTAMGTVARALADGTVRRRLRGPVAQTGFRRLT